MWKKPRTLSKRSVVVKSLVRSTERNRERHSEREQPTTQAKWPNKIAQENSVLWLLRFSARDTETGVCAAFEWFQQNCVQWLLWLWSSEREQRAAAIVWTGQERYRVLTRSKITLSEFGSGWETREALWSMVEWFPCAKLCSLAYAFVNDQVIGEDKARVDTIRTVLHGRVAIVAADRAETEQDPLRYAHSFTVE